MILSNLHTHTVYCDGKNTPEEMVLTAIRKGFSSLGFSGHAYTPHDDSYCMTPDNTLKYIDEINLLKEKYKDKIEIYLGCECDLYSLIDRSKYDYTIGSVHYVKTPDGNLHPIDHTEDIMIDVVNKYFNSDFYSYIKSYYEAASQISKLKPDIVGHFDLVVKFNEGNKYFDQTSKKYLYLAFDAMDAVIPHCDLFEVNTGAISRGYKSTPYPDALLLKRLLEKGADITLTSDCHNADFLDCHFQEAQQLLKEIGFKSAYILQGGKFVEQSL
ncbi:MAG: histidinol-phosphatase [Clostridia bacterium]|nr:histidinol-phosphatase [Clostridia bacterium]